jgi:glutamyl endopeptidase
MQSSRTGKLRRKQGGLIMQRTMLQSFKTLTLAALMAGSAATAFAAGDSPIASDGKSYASRSATADRIPPSLGTGAVTRAALAATGVSFAHVPRVGVNGLLSVAYGDTAEAGSTRSIIGWDSRMRTNPLGYPNRAIVYIERNGAAHCTGWMINSNTLATAGHCVHTGGSSGSFYPVSSFRVYPGYDGSGAGAYGSCTVRRSHSVTGWTSSGSSNFDYGAMRLNCTVGSVVGNFGIWAPPQSTLLGQPIVLAGYPGDKPKTQWTSSDTIRNVTTTKFSYRADTVGGQSGSPVWNSGPDALWTSGAWGIAIHTNGVGSACASNTNCATLLTAARITNYNTWRNAPN